MRGAEQERRGAASGSDGMARCARRAGRLMVLLSIVLAVGRPTSSAGAAPAAATDGKCAPAGNGITCIYEAIDREQVFVVPAGVTSLYVVAEGGNGGEGGNERGADGGHGANIQGELPVTPGQTLYIAVGGGGGAGHFYNSGGDGGWNGGANGGNDGYGLSSGPGGGGAGATDVRTVPRSEGDASLHSRLLVAGGGGGGGGGGGSCDTVHYCDGGRGGDGAHNGAGALTGGYGGDAGTVGRGDVATGVPGGNDGNNGGGAGGGGGWWGGWGGDGGNSNPDDANEWGGGGGGGGGGNLLPEGFGIWPWTNWPHLSIYHDLPGLGGTAGGPRFQAYVDTHGGLARFGQPLGAPRVERLEDGKEHTVQYFERARLEYHPENQAPHNVLIGQLGRLYAPVDPLAAPAPGATYFPETGHNAAGRFLAYWQANGGLASFGLPLTEERQERLEDGKEYTVQYFERARLEYHPENAPPHDVLLGQLGRRAGAGR